jgi:hypothetical protein
VAERQEIGKRMQVYLTHERPDLLSMLRHRLESEDTSQEGLLSADKIAKVLSQTLGGVLNDKEAERWVRNTFKGDKRGRIKMEEVMLKLENNQER